MINAIYASESDQPRNMETILVVHSFEERPMPVGVFPGYRHDTWIGPAGDLKTTLKSSVLLFCFPLRLSVCLSLHLTILGIFIAHHPMQIFALTIT